MTLPRGRTALLLIDMQEEHRTDTRYLVEAYDTVAANCALLLVAARTAGMAVFHTVYLVDTQADITRPFHPLGDDGRSAFSDAGTPGAEISPELTPLPGETVIVKRDASCFTAPQLPQMLDRAGIDWLVIGGCWSEACVAATVKDAVERGIHVLLVKDACGSGSQAMHETAVLNIANRLYGGAVADTARALSLMGGGVAQTWQTNLPVPMKFTYETASRDYAAL
ncbi:isochorismatase family protein [Tabrizicola sp.]|uniref:isochorismatase family protein n=1 Tax=Tabrizicola sp. TaxID=2005166 RepID=UPI002FDD97AD